MLNTTKFLDYCCVKHFQYPDSIVVIWHFQLLLTFLSYLCLQYKLGTHLIRQQGFQLCCHFDFKRLKKDKRKRGKHLFTFRVKSLSCDTTMRSSDKHFPGKRNKSVKRLRVTLESDTPCFPVLRVLFRLGM